VICLQAPPSFMAVGSWYRDFTQTTDEEVVRMLEEERADSGETSADEVEVSAGDVVLPGYLAVPRDVRGIVIFAHGSGSGRDSPRNQHVARLLDDGGLATLLLDLLTPAESQSREKVFDIGLLASRLEAAAGWAAADERTRDLPIGLFGASTGAAAALVTAARMGKDVVAVVSRGGRPDLAADQLGDVAAPTLLIVGERDEFVLQLNEDAAAQLTADHEIVVVPDASHLFEEPGALDRVAEEARAWFVRHMGGAT
jgi:putative phosphoribosyl transferase